MVTDATDITLNNVTTPRQAELRAQPDGPHWASFWVVATAAIDQVSA